MMPKTILIHPCDRNKIAHFASLTDARVVDSENWSPDSVGLDGDWTEHDKDILRIVMPGWFVRDLA